MRKFSFLTIALVVCSLTITATASAADRYAYPDGDATNAATCGYDENCDLVSAMDPALAVDAVRMEPGEYTVTTPLELSAPGAGLFGEGTTAADVVINSTVTDSPALTLSNGTEAEDFTLNTVTSSGVSGGLSLIDGIVSHIAVTATGEQANACTGIDARFVNSLCRATGTFGSAFKITAAEPVSLEFFNSTLYPGPYGYGFAETALGISAEVSVEVLSTIIVSGLGHPIMLNQQAGAPAPSFNAEYSNYECTQTIVGSDNGECVPPVDATNQTAAPIFTDAANGDFTQAADSPTIDAGAVNGLSGDHDLPGNTRVQGAAVDIGAYEFTPPVVIPPATVEPIIAPIVIPDTMKPTLSITKKPKSKTTSKKVSVSFKTNETATYLCKLDKGKFKTCKSPYKKSKLKIGKHKLQIKATDAAGNVSSVKTIKWTVKKK